MNSDSGRVLAASWLTAAVITSPPHMSSSDTRSPSSCIASRSSAVRVRPPTRLILRLTDDRTAVVLRLPHVGERATPTRRGRAAAASRGGRARSRRWCGRAARRRRAGPARPVRRRSGPRPGPSRRSRRRRPPCSSPPASTQARVRSTSVRGSLPTLSWNRSIPAARRAPDELGHRRRVPQRHRLVERPALGQHAAEQVGDRTVERLARRGPSRRRRPGSWRTAGRAGWRPSPGSPRTGFVGSSPSSAGASSARRGPDGAGGGRAGRSARASSPRPSPSRPSSVRSRTRVPSSWVAARPPDITYVPWT